MVFPSVPMYLDPPNWNQQQAHQPSGGSGGGGGGGSEPHSLAPPLAAAPHAEAGMAGSVRPVSMAERARLAKVPQPEPALKCPRCDSTNTKFCYFNNYSLSQPRHFCKTCRRYWTRGGALRNVPVGGGCRRNKRSKASGGSSKSSTTSSADRQSGASSSSSSAAMAASSGAISPNIQLPPQLSFMASLHPLGDYGTSNMGLNFTGIQPLDAVDYQVGSGSTSVGLEQWSRLQQIQQFPFMVGLESSAPAPVSGLYPFDGDGGVDHATGYTAQGQMKPSSSSSGLITQFASVKMEDNSHALNLPRHYLGIPGNDQYWGIHSGGSGSSGGGGSSAGGSSLAWTTDLSGFNTPSSGNIL